MFEVGSIVYFKNPNHFGIVENTAIGYRWCSEKGCDEMHTAPLFAATAGILKSKFKVAAVNEDQESNNMLVTVRSVDKDDLMALVVPEFLVMNANTSSIPNASEKRLLLYLHSLSEFGAPPPVSAKEEKSETTSEQLDSSANKGQKPVKSHDCTNCGKCSNKKQGHRNTTKDLKYRADIWEKLFSGGSHRCEESVDEDPDTDIVDIDDFLDSLRSEIISRLEAKKAEEKLRSFRNTHEYGPFCYSVDIPVSPTSQAVPKSFDEFIRKIFG